MKRPHGAGRTGFHMACQNGRLQAVNRLLQVDNIDVNKRDTYYGMTPLGAVCNAEGEPVHLDIVKRLLAVEVLMSTVLQQTMELHPSAQQYLRRAANRLQALVWRL